MKRASVSPTYDHEGNVAIVNELKELETKRDQLGKMWFNGLMSDGDFEIDYSLCKNLSEDELKAWADVDLFDDNGIMLSERELAHELSTQVMTRGQRIQFADFLLLCAMRATVARLSETYKKEIKRRLDYINVNLK